MEEGRFLGSYIVIEEKKLVVELLSGIMTLKSYREYKQKQSSDVLFSPDYNLISYTEDLLVDATVDQVSDYVDFILINGNVAGKRKTDSVIHTTNLHVYALIFEKLHENKGLLQEYRVFSDVQEAIDWLDVDLSILDMFAIIDRLRSQLTV
jgi:hypothetical protein